MTKINIQVTKESQGGNWQGGISKLDLNTYSDNVCIHKMNDTMCDDDIFYLKNHNTLTKIFLKYDGYDDKEINIFLKNNKKPTFQMRLEKRSKNKGIIEIPKTFQIENKKILFPSNQGIQLKTNI